MGTRGETNDRTLTFGSNSLEIMKHEHCPVLVIHENYDYRAPREVLFPTDFGVIYKRRELKLLGNMMTFFRSNITFLYIDPAKEMAHEQKDNKLFLVSSLQRPKLFFETTPEPDKILAITKHIIGNDFDMLVMVNTRQSYLNEVLPQPQSTIRKLGLQVKIPFLVFQNIAR